MKLQTDIIAERIRVFGMKPKNTLKEHLELSHIVEIKEELTPIAMVKEILKDFQILHNSLLGVMSAALETGDSATEEIASEFTRRLEKRHWMFTSWSKN